MKVLFFGNHTVGVNVLKAIQNSEEVVGVVAHPKDAEDGVRYASVFDYANKQGWNVIRSKGNDSQLLGYVQNCKPNLIVIADYRYLLPDSIVSYAQLGAINFHPSILPKYRGRAPINWAILNGEQELGLTVHFVDGGMDTGDIIAQESFQLNEAQDVGDALAILYPIYSSLTQLVLQYYRQGLVPRFPQNHERASVYPARKPEDGLIDWNQSVTDILNLIRAVALPYPGAFSTLAGQKITIWHAFRLDSSIPSDSERVPGKIMASDSRGLVVQCNDALLVLDKVEYAANLLRPNIGMVFGAEI